MSKLTNLYIEHAEIFLGHIFYIFLSSEKKKIYLYILELAGLTFSF